MQRLMLVLLILAMASFTRVAVAADFSFQRHAKGGAMMCDVYDLASCPTGEACYLSVQTGDTACAVPSSPGVQHDDCEFINACEPGLGCVLNNSPVNPTGLVCAHFCQPRSGVITQGGFCTDVPQLADGATVCVALNEFYSNVDSPVGMCIDCDIYPCDKIYVSSFESG